MALGNHSKFYYGHVVDATNYAINFNEGGSELSASIRQGTYSLSEYALAVASALNATGSLTYSVNVDRATRLLTIEASGEFTLLFDTGSLHEVSAAEMMGFTEDDFEDVEEITSSFASGEEYRTQFWLQDYVAPGDSQSLIDAVVNTSANGETEVVRFGSQSFIEFSLKYITNNEVDKKESDALRYNSQGLLSARSFMEYLITKGRFEFMPDENDADTFHTVLLEKTPESNIGTGFKLKEMVARGIPGFYESGVLTLKIVGGA